MTYEITTLLDRIQYARKKVIQSVKQLTNEQVNFKPSPEEWSIQQIVEHLVWAENAGICGMFKALAGIRNQDPIWSGESANQGLSIEEIIEKTWKPKEVVPQIAEPRWGGPMSYWIASFENCDRLLIQLHEFSDSVDLEHAIYPHPISGPLNVVQRLEFLRFHMERHLEQIERVKSHKDFPISNAIKH